MSEATGWLLIQRPKEGARDKFRSYRVEVDGVAVGKVRRGRSLKVAVPAGWHEIRAAIDWTGSRTVRVEVRPTELTQVIVSPGGAAFSLDAFAREQEYLQLTVVDEGPASKQA